MYEKKHEKPIAPSSFARRLFTHLAIAMCVIVLSLTAGMVGYVYFEHLPWVDAFLNAAMLLGGMGPVNLPQTTAGKLFAGGYALYAGLIFIAVSALMFTPVFHRLIHRFHWSEEL